MTDGKAQKRSIDPDAVYSREEAAEALGISLSTLKKLINAGYLRVSQPAGIRRIFIKGESILAMLDETMIERRARQSFTRGGTIDKKEQPQYCFYGGRT